MSPILVLASLALYLLLLLGLGYYAEKKMSSGQGFAYGGFFYSMSLAVYATTWTFYGSIGNASSSGLLFIAIYIGPTVGALLWGPVLSRLIRIKNGYRITSIIDFISARYNKSISIGVVLTVFVVIGFIPYNALQLKSIMSTTSLMLAHSAALDPYHFLVEYVILVLITMFIIFFGLRRLDPTERHPGMVSVLAVESFVKLFAAVGAGIFIVYVLSDGVEGLVRDLPLVVDPQKYFYFGYTGVHDLFNWFSWLALASAAVLFLPRQFHVAVIENSDERHVQKAQWIFPLYLLIANIFVLPIAIYGLKNGVSGAQAESFLLEAPLKAGENALALVIFLGGFSAGIGMITVSVVTVSTMVTNHLLMPLSDRQFRLRFLRGRILESRWVAASLIIVLAYFYQRFFSGGAALVSMGMISFVAAFQFVPPILFGLFWSKVNSKGALLGIVLGCVTWAYTLFIPAFFNEGAPLWLTAGPWGFSELRPQALFGVSGLSSIAHSFFWTSLFNCSGLIVGSLLFKTSSQEKIHTEDFLNIARNRMQRSRSSLGPLEISLAEKSEAVIGLFNQYFPLDRAKQILQQCLDDANINSQQISIGQLADLSFAIERSLAGVIGSAGAHYAVRQAQIISDTEEKSLSHMFAQMLSTLRVSPLEFKKRVDFQIARADILRQQKDELEKLLSLRMKEVEKMQVQLVQSSKMSALGEMAGGVAHEINTPLAVIHLTLEQFKINLEEEKLDKVWGLQSVDKLLRVTQRIATIIKGLRVFSSSDEKQPLEVRRVLEILDETMAFCQEKFKNHSISIKIDVDPDITVESRSVSLSQVFLNLLNNAADAIATLEKKWVLIEAKADGAFIEISVTDSGSGIPEVIVHKVMQPFFTTKGVGQGVGIGLSISKGIVEDHQGTLNIDRKSAHTRFVVRIPQRQS